MLNDSYMCGLLIAFAFKQISVLKPCFVHPNHGNLDKEKEKIIPVYGEKICAFSLECTFRYCHYRLLHFDENCLILMWFPPWFLYNRTQTQRKTSV